MDAFTVAARLLGGLEPGPGQLAQLRAVNSRHYQRLYTLLHASGSPPGSGGSASAREPTPAERRELHALLVRDVRAALSHAQGGGQDPRGARGPDPEDFVLAWEWEGGRLG